MLSDFIHYFMSISPTLHTRELKLREISNSSKATAWSGKAGKRTLVSSGRGWAVRHSILPSHCGICWGYYLFWYFNRSSAWNRKLWNYTLRQSCKICIGYPNICVYVCARVCTCVRVCACICVCARACGMWWPVHGIGVSWIWAYILVLILTGYITWDSY